MFKKGNQFGNRKGRTKTLATITAQQMREKLVAFVGEKMNPLLDAKADLALGHCVMIARKWESKKEGFGKKARFVRHRSGPFEVIKDEATVLELINSDGQGDNYHKIVLEKPDNAAQNYLLDQAIGRAKETVVNEGGPMVNIDKAIILQLDKAYGQGKHIGNGKVETAI